MVNKQMDNTKFTLCNKCGKRADDRFTTKYGSIIGTCYYCSESCKKSHAYPLNYFILSLLAFIMSIILLFISKNFIFVAPAVIFTIVSFFLMVEFFPMIEFPKSDRKMDGTMIYSKQLKKEILRCCYQSARLNDKYCICGRAVEYPVN